MIEREDLDEDEWHEEDDAHTGLMPRPSLVPTEVVSPVLGDEDAWRLRSIVDALVRAATTGDVASEYPRLSREVEGMTPAGVTFLTALADLLRMTATLFGPGQR